MKQVRVWQTSCCVFIFFILMGYIWAEDLISLHPSSAMVRLAGVEGVLPPAGNSHAIEMVRGENEGVQVAMCSVDGLEHKILSVNVRPLSKGSPAFDMYRVLGVNHTAPADEKEGFHIPSRRLGWLPDVLMPMEKRHRDAWGSTGGKGEIPVIAYIEFQSKAETQPGTYRYECVVEYEKGTSKLELEIRVHRVTIPIRLPFRTSICWNQSLNKYFGAPLTIGEKKVFWNFCLDYRLSPCAFYGREPDPSPNELSDLKVKGLSVVSLMNFKGGKKLPFGGKVKIPYEELLPQWRNELKKLELLDDVILFLADEPSDGVDTSEIQVQLEKVRKLFPEVKALVATQPKLPWSKFTDIFDVVTMYSSDFYKPHAHDEGLRKNWLKSRPDAKLEYWWFHSVEPYAPYANLRLDNLPIEARVIGWQNAQYRIDGYEYFWIADWGENEGSKDLPWPKRASEWKTGRSGAGNLCYPDEQKQPMPSLRLVNLRDGIEDWALLELLHPRKSNDQECEWISPVSKNLAEYSVKPSVLLEQRLKVIQALEK